MGLSGSARHLCELQKGCVGGTKGLAVREADSEAMSGRLCVVAHSLNYE